MDKVEKADVAKPKSGAELFKSVDFIKQMIYYKFDRLLYHILLVNLG